MKIVLSVILFSLSAVLSAQSTLDWAFGKGGNSIDAVLGQAVDNNGNLISVGYFTGTMDLNPGPGFLNVTSNGSTDIFIQKLDADGNFVWGKKIGGVWGDQANDVAVDNSGNVYVTGSFRNTVDFNPGTGVYNLTAETTFNRSAVFVLKLSSTGNFQWARAAETQSSGNAVDVDGSGNVYVVGDILDWVEFDNISIGGDLFLWKLNGSGAQQWVQALDEVGVASNLSIGRHGMKVDDAGNMYVTGGFSGTQDLEPGPGVFNMVSNGPKDVYLLKVNSSGVFQWVEQYGGADSEVGLALDIDDNVNIYITGTFSGITDLDPGSGTGQYSFLSAGGDDVFALKTDANGNVLWGAGFGGSGMDYAGDITSNSAGQATITGLFSGTADFDPDLVETYNLVSNGGDDIYLVNLTSDGILNWAYSFGSTGIDKGWAVQSYQDNLYAGGEFSGTVDFDPSASVFNITANENSDAYIFKLGECAATSSTITAAVCDSYESPSGNQTWTSSGSYLDTIPNAAGCDSVITVNLTIEDLESPVPDNASLEPVVAECNLTTIETPSATDNCSGAIAATHNATFPITSSTTITWTYDDGNGNTSSQTQEVIIDDVTAPVADVETLVDIIAECEVTSLNAPSATDDCEGSVTGTHNATFPITSSTTITWTYDDGNGNTSTQTQEVIIDDVTAPVADAGSLSDVIAECEVTSLTPPTATDNCQGTVSGTHNTTFPITSSTAITWTYDDGNGNTTTQTQEVVINDTTAPVANTATLADVMAQCEVNSLTAPTATDNCSGTVIGTPNVALPITTQGSFNITWTYDDGNGNTTTQSQSVIIDDSTAPVADNAVLSNVTDECSASPTAPTATDNCGGTITGIPNVAFPVTTAGTTAVTWTYDDGNGNTTTQTQDVIITPIDNGITQFDAVTLGADAAGYFYQWIDCNNDDQPIDGATDQTFTAPDNGSYGVEITNGECTVISECINLLTVGLDTNEKPLVSVFPNPTNGAVTVTSPNGFERVQITNALGQTVFNLVNVSDSNLMIELPEAAGIYLLHTEANGIHQTTRVLKH